MVGFLNSYRVGSGVRKQRCASTHHFSLDKALPSVKNKASATCVCDVLIIPHSSQDCVEEILTILFAVPLFSPV